MILVSVRAAVACWLQCNCIRSRRCVSVRVVSSTTLDTDEVTRFSQLAAGWWDTTRSGGLMALHRMNQLRVPLIRDALVRQRSATSNSPLSALHSSTPLAGITVLDVGCGGGILSEPLARLGAQVTGIDASAELIEIAKWHAALDSNVENQVTYKTSTIEDLCNSNAANDCVQLYDGVVASEIVEHVSDAKMFVDVCCSLVKPGGSLFFTTISRTLCSYGLAVVAAERLLRLVPHDAHDWNKFVLPAELKDLVTQSGFSVRLIHGMILNPITLNWLWMRNTSLGYALHAVKPADHSVDV